MYRSRPRYIYFGFFFPAHNMLTITIRLTWLFSVFYWLYIKSPLFIIKSNINSKNFTANECQNIYYCDKVFCISSPILNPRAKKMPTKTYFQSITFIILLMKLHIFVMLSNNIYKVILDDRWQVPYDSYCCGCQWLKIFYQYMTSKKSGLVQYKTIV